MTIKPWREIAVPHPDVLKGTFQQAEFAAGVRRAAMPEKGEKVRQLAYHLCTICDRNKWAGDARPYNDLVTAWTNIITASTGSSPKSEQFDLEL